MKKIALFFLLILISSSIFARGFELETQKETAFAFLGTTVLTFAFLANNNKNALDLKSVDIFNKNSVNSFDRTFAVFSYDKTIASVSDFSLISLSLTPSLFYFSKKFRTKEKFLIPVLFAEVLALNTGINFIVKNMVSRKRPYVYETNKNYEKRTSSDATRSFYSGHSSLAFACATFSSAMFWEYYPQSKWKIPITISLFSLATTIASLRVLAGQHFLSDVAFGALMGSATASFVLLSHKKDNLNFSIFPLKNGGMIAFNYKF